MAEITNVTYLQRKAYDEQEFTKLVDITSYPDLGGAPEQIDITTLTDKKLRNMNGLQAGDGLEFGALYKQSDYEKLNDIMLAERDADEDEISTYRLLFGENGVNGIWEWQGRLSVYANGGEPNARRDMSFTISDEGEQEIHYVEPTPPPAVVHVTGVSLDTDTLSMEVGGNDETLVATVTPADATDRSVSWESDDEEVATVSDGVVHAVAEGTATITVTTTDGSFTDTCEVTVTET